MPSWVNSRNHKEWKYRIPWPNVKMQCTWMAATSWHLSTIITRTIANTLNWWHKMNISMMMASLWMKISNRFHTCSQLNNINLKQSPFTQWVHSIKKWSQITSTKVLISLKSSNTRSQTISWELKGSVKRKKMKIKMNSLMKTRSRSNRRFRQISRITKRKR